MQRGPRKTFCQRRLHHLPAIHHSANQCRPSGREPCARLCYQRVRVRHKGLGQNGISATHSLVTVASFPDVVNLIYRLTVSSRHCAAKSTSSVGKIQLSGLRRSQNYLSFSVILVLCIAPCHMYCVRVFHGLFSVL